MNELSINDSLDEIESESYDFIWEEWEEYKGDVPLWQHIFCGSIAGLMEHVSMYPLDTIKTYFQTSTKLKCKKKFENCNIYSCHNNYKELNTYRNLHIDKRNFCSSMGCDNCLNKTCNYENYCNIKVIPHVNKKKISYLNILETLKKKNKLNKSHYSNWNMQNKKINHIVSKKLQCNHYCNKRINTYLNNNNCVNASFKYLLNLKKNKRKLCDISEEKFNKNFSYKYRNNRINYLKRNINKVEDNMDKVVTSKIKKLSNIYENDIRNGIKEISPNIKKKLSLFSLNNKEKRMYFSRKVTSKIILKKEKTKYKRPINYYKHSFNNKNIKNYGNKKLSLLQTSLKIKQNNYAQLEKNNFLFSRYMGKNVNIKDNNRFNFITNENNVTLINNFKNICVQFMNKCYNTNNVKSNNKRKTVFKFSFQNFLKNADKNNFKILSNPLSFLKKTNYYSMNYVFKKNFIYKNYYLNILNEQKKKNNLNVFVYMFQNMKNFLTNFTHKNVESGTNKIIKKNNVFSILCNERNILLNNVCISTKTNNTHLFGRSIHSLNKYNHYKSNKISLFDRNIYSVNKNNLYKNNIVNGFSNNFKSFNFFKNIFIHKNKKNDVKIIRYNCNLIRNNFSNLYKGVNVVMLGCIPAHAMYFSTFEYSKKYFSSMSSSNSTIKILNNNKADAINCKLNDLNYFSIIVSGFLATIAHDLIITPVDTLKQRIQLGINKNGLDSIKILRENGIRSLYLSLPITLIMNIPYHIIMICTNEQMKKIYFEYMCGINNLHKNSSENKFNNTQDDNTIKKDNRNIEENVKNINVISEVKNNNKTNDRANESADKIINNLKDDNNKVKLIKYYIDQDIYSMNNFRNNRENKFFQEDGEDMVKSFSKEKHNNSHILFKEIIKKLENDCNNPPENYDNKIRDSLKFEKQQYVDLKNMWTNNYKNEFFSKHFNHITSYFVCAGIGGGIAAILTNPFDVIKTRIQTECFNTKRFHFFKVVSNLYYKEGLSSFFKGSLARMALCIPASAISWGSYETMKRFFKIHFNSI